MIYFIPSSILYRFITKISDYLVFIFYPNKFIYPYHEFQPKALSPLSTLDIFMIILLFGAIDYLSFIIQS